MSRLDFKCGSCNGTVTARWTTIRAKRSRVVRLSKLEAYRVYAVRVVNADGSEELIEFSADAFGNDIEMRARDIVHFLFFNGQIGVIENVTLGRRMVLNTFPDPPPWTEPVRRLVPPRSEPVRSKPVRPPDLDFLRPAAYIIAVIAFLGFTGCCLLGLLGMAVNPKKRK
jgi:hypothetical protein